MNDTEVEHVSMFVKVKTFLTRKAPQLVATPIISTTLQPAFNNKVQEILEEDEDASSTITGNTEFKRQLRLSVENRAFEIGAAVAGYYTLTVPNRVLSEKCNYQRSELTRMRDMILYVKCAKIHEIAEPVKNLLLPFGITDTDVDDFGTALSAYFTDLENPRDAIGERAASGRQVERLIDQAFDILENQLDVVMKVYAQRDPELYDYYQNARSIDQTGGGAIPDEDEEIVLPASQWIGFVMPPEVTAGSRIVIANKASNPNVVSAGLSTSNNSHSGPSFNLSPGQTEDRPASEWGYTGPSNWLVFNNTFGPAASNITVRVKVYY
jgi:hypothetical protein